MIYLASPYSHNDPAVRQRRFEQTCDYVAEIIKEKHICFSPIVHFHPVAVRRTLPYDAEYWKAVNYWFLEKCDLVAVLMLDGWEYSYGVEDEIKMAGIFGKSIIMCNPGLPWSQQVLCVEGKHHD